MLIQSFVERRPVDTNQWETELRGRSWMAALLVFAGLIVLCCAPLYLDLVSRQFQAALLVFLVSLLFMHVITLSYVLQRPGT